MSVLHDIGKVATPDNILHKQGKLTPKEKIIIKEHTTNGKKLIDDAFKSHPKVGKIASIIAY